MPKPLSDFMEFIREQGVPGLAVGFILGGTVAKVVSSFVNDLINPLLGLALGAVGGLKGASVKVGGAEVTYGNFLANLIDFGVIAFVVFVAVKAFRLKDLKKK